jgi:hypothetical protein
MAERRLLTCKELEEGIAMQEKNFAYWGSADPNFERREKVISMQQNSIACYRELLRERKKASMKQTSVLSFVKIPPPQSSPVIPKPSDSELPTSTPVRSPSKSSLEREREREREKIV